MPRFLSFLFLTSFSSTQLDYSDLSPSFVQTISTLRRKWASNYCVESHQLADFLQKMSSQTRAVVPYSAEEYCDESRLTDHNASGRLAIITDTVTSDMNNEGPLGRWVGVIKTTISSPTATVIAWKDIFEADLATESSASTS